MRVGRSSFHAITYNDKGSHFYDSQPNDYIKFLSPNGEISFIRNRGWNDIIYDAILYVGVGRVFVWAPWADAVLLFGDAGLLFGDARRLGHSSL